MIRTAYNMGIATLTLMSLVVVSSSCKRGHDNTGLEYAPQMYDAVGYEPYRQVRQNNVNPMGLNMRLPAAGTVARPNYQTKFGTGDSTSADLMLYNIPSDSIRLSELVLTNPIPQTEQSLADGKVLYGRYCQHCHGEGGKGDGPVAAQYKGVPNYSSDALKTLNDGHIFHVITNGKGRMWPHGSQVTPDDRWKIVQYVHKLQQG
ncbi:MAG: cytochrome c [Hymenobacter sp.]|nr:MAG: cytochrome c [Hymenobacter sp.]